LKASAFHSAIYLLITFASLVFAEDVDPYIWLEATTPTPAVQAWSAQQNAKTERVLTQDPRYAPTKSLFTELIYSADRLPNIASYSQGQIYNLWQDQQHPHGLYRRVSLTGFSAATPSWDVLFDVDALSRAEGINWVWKGISCLEPENRQCLIWLSNGGKDASVVREYDMQLHQFVTSGFNLPEAKTEMTWIDKDTVFVTTGEGPDSLTESGYPRILRRWKRGQALGEAHVILTAQKTDYRVEAEVARDSSGLYMTASRIIDFGHTDLFLVKGDALQQLPFPTDANVQLGAGGYAFVMTKTPWNLGGRTYGTGNLLAFSVNDLGSTHPLVVFEPTDKMFLSGLQLSGDNLYISVLNNVSGELYRTNQRDAFASKVKIELPAMGTVTLMPSKPSESTLIFSFNTFLDPVTYFTLAPGSLSPSVLKAAPSRFDTAKYVTEQFQSTSKDGTKIPYFIVHARDWHLDGNNPTLQYGYGGFEENMTPFYSAAFGQAWLDKGGVFVLANIRGGDEFGPAWHTAALKENRQRAYDDFISVAEDLIARQVTKPAKLGIEGGSNGGLLVGATFVERPDLFNAVVCQVPLLDMIRFPSIFAGASWENEYGDPNDPQIRAAILKYSPYQNVKANVHYPKVLFMTSSTDDRVGPAHARKMAAKMLDQGHDILFYEDTEGGHGGQDNPEETIRSEALTFTYLYQQLMTP
jgi:prolyl oligopeptidase